MTEDMIRQLMAAGLKRQQATSATTEMLVNLFMKEDGKVLIKEAQRQVSEMQSMVSGLRKEYDSLLEKMKGVAETLTAISEAQDQYGEVSDDKAKNVIALYGALLNMNEKAGAPGIDSVKNAGYVVYAYLGGQAKREISYAPDNA